MSIIPYESKGSTEPLVPVWVRSEILSISRVKKYNGMIDAE